MILSEYDPNWKTTFQEFERIYSKALGDLISGIEHVGSTAIIGIAAKPIIDIDLIMRDDAALPEISQVLAQLGYRHNGDQGVPQREAFNRQDQNAPWISGDHAWMNHHLYACPPHSSELWRHVTFRDYLNQDRAARDRYEAIKREIESRSNGDRKVYAQIKETEGICTAFVEDILKQASSNS